MQQGLPTKENLGDNKTRLAQKINLNLKKYDYSNLERGNFGRKQ